MYFIYKLPEHTSKVLRVLFWKADRIWLELHGTWPLVGPGAGPWEEDFSMDRQLAFEYFPKDAVELKNN